MSEHSRENQRAPESVGEKSRSEVARESLGYVTRPNFYPERPSKKPWILAALALACVAAVVAVVLPQNNAFVDPMRAPASVGGSPAAAVLPETAPKVDVQRVTDEAVIAAIPGLDPLMRAKLRSGEARVIAFRVAIPAQKGDLLGIQINGARLGQLDLGTRDAKLFAIVETNKLLSIREQIEQTGPGGEGAGFGFVAPDGRQMQGQVRTGATLEWSGLFR